MNHYGHDGFTEAILANNVAAAHHIMMNVEGLLDPTGECLIYRYSCMMFCVRLQSEENS